MKKAKKSQNQIKNNIIVVSHIQVLNSPWFIELYVLPENPEG